MKTKAQDIEPNISARAIKNITGKTGNIYESVVVISKRANQISNEIKNELHQKLEEFASVTDTIEEVHENKEQIEISKFYERLPNPTIIALNEFMQDELDFEMLGADEEKEDEDLEP